MELKLLKPRLALNKAFLKVKPSRPEIELFKSNLIRMIDTINESESEEFHKNEVSKFLQNTFYSSSHYINTKDRKDLVIHNDVTASSTVGVIIEAKRPAKTAEMLRTDNINYKAFQELVYYYLKERITHKNLEIKHLIATNIYEWFVFDAHLFEKLFAQNKSLVKQFIDFEEKRAGGANTDFFYTQIAAPAIEAIKQEVSFSHFDIRDYEKPLRNNNPKDDNLLIALYKLLSPQHLLKKPFANDSNSLDKTFYSELLHIIGLTEIKEGGKKLIQRKPKAERNAGSLIESAIVQLENLDKIARLDKPSQFGATTDERLFNVALELSITWVNRILFLKLLEAQLIKYHKGDASFAFLNTSKVKGFDDLNTLFFQVLAKKTEERNEHVSQKFAHVPYLNSSLFEPTDIEHVCFTISQLEDAKIPLLTNTVIKDNTGKKRTGELLAVEYIFEFLNAYDFSSEGSEEIQEDNKRLINASVLGLIFEKINGYKDGSFFTPGFITMYMCRETIRRAVVQKFNDSKGWNCKGFNELYDHIEDRSEANTLINSLKICDPAVGSGHFLVSALNELIAIKSELRILQDREGKRMKEYTVQVENDELVVTDDDGQLFEYNPLSRESQRVQETLFHEKQTIIENCLFGVDINPNSVKICRLRLWIELLKNAYYRVSPVETRYATSLQRELETLPNIDINIKCGNSLISRFALDADLKQALRSSKYSIVSYRSAVDLYRNAQNKEQKREMEKLIATIKSDFRSNIDNPFIKKISYARGTVDNLASKINTSKQWGENADKRLIKEFETAVSKLDKLEKERDDIEANKIYENAFEWRFEFPEVLNDDGDFIGFDVVIGNPPYIKEYEGKEIFDGLREKEVYQGKMDIWYLFGAHSIEILRNNGHLSFIAPNNWTTNSGASKFRNYMIKNSKFIELIDFNSFMVFDTASIQTMIMSFEKYKFTAEYQFNLKRINVKEPSMDNALSMLNDNVSEQIEILSPTINSNCIDNLLTFSNDKFDSIFIKIKEKQNFILDEKNEIAQGIVFPQDFINKASAYKLNDLSLLGHGVFALKNQEIENLNLLENEQNLIKPYFTSGQFFRYYALSNNNLWLIYTSSKFKNASNIAPYPNIKNHIDKFSEIITSDNKPYGLHRSREESFFIGEKIIIQRKCPNKPVFSYTDFDCYVSATFYVIKTNRLSQKYLTGLLNSKLIEFWLRHKGKMQGSNFQLDKEPLLNIPIIKANIEIENKISEIVSKIISEKHSIPTADITALETEIDQLVYELYGLTEEEIKIVEGEK